MSTTSQVQETHKIFLETIRQFFGIRLYFEIQNMKQTAFTLIELLVVIVIIGILATVSTATFSGNLAKSRDAQRITAVNQMAKLIESNGIGRDYYLWGTGPTDYHDDEAKYTYTHTDLKTLFTENGYALPPAENNICYLFHLIGPTNIDTTAAFSVSTWGETTSTANPGTPGIIFAGTPDVENNFTIAGSATYPIVSGFSTLNAPAEEDFNCDDFATNIGASFGVQRSYVKIAQIASGANPFLNISGVQTLSGPSGQYGGLKITTTPNQELCLTHALPGTPCE